MKILVRCDSSSLIGTGHVVRTLALAQKLKDEGHEVIFVSRELSGNVIDIIGERQFKVLRLPRPHTSILNPTLYESWLAVPYSQEIKEFEEIVRDERPSWIIVDHYGLPSDWESRWKTKGIRILAIDDILRDHECDILLDQNLHRNARKTYLSAGKVGKAFLGPHYAMLAASFTEKKEFFSPDVRKVMVFFGGVDATGETWKLLQSLHEFPDNLTYDVVLGKQNPYFKEITEFIAKNPSCRLHVQTMKMNELMCNADVFLGAGGATTWERCFVGLPSICVALAENQIEIAKNLHEKGIVEYLGESHHVNGKDYARSLISLSEDHERRRAYQQGSLELQVGSKFKEFLSEVKD